MKIKIDEILKALSEPTRIKILCIIYVRNVNLCNIVDFLGLSYPTISIHIKTLKEIGIIEVQKNGRWQELSLYKNNKNKIIKFIIDNFELLFEDYLLNKKEIKKLDQIIEQKSCNIT